MGERGFEITFHGVRGSTPCHGADVLRYGGNTSCVAIDVPGHPPILLDFGTGARYFGRAWPAEVPFDGICLASHLHWDHVQGLPFFPPLLRDGSRLTIHGPRQDDGRTLDEVIHLALRPPTFPVSLHDLRGEFVFVEHHRDEFTIGEIEVIVRPVPHIGPTVGYRITYGGASLAYISDHQQPHIDQYSVCDEVVELAGGADLLIHDAQFVRAEFARKADWGHCTLDYAAWLAREVGAQTLALFHHDPAHDDDRIDELVSMTRKHHPGLHLFAAAEGMRYRVGVGPIVGS